MRSRDARRLGRSSPPVSSTRSHLLKSGYGRRGTDNERNRAGQQATSRDAPRLRLFAGRTFFRRGAALLIGKRGRKATHRCRPVEGGFSGTTIRVVAGGRTSWT